MADWFKFFNDHLDSAGMQYCLSEQPLVTGVWLVILSEASKNRSCDIPWDQSDFRLLGFARKLNISPGIFNQCINLLKHTGYIKLTDSKLTVPGWEKLQSDYAKGLDKGYYENTRKKLASNSLVSRTRGEESRGEENRIKGEPPVQNGKLGTAERITLEKSLDRVDKRIFELREADLPAAVAERKLMREERKSLLEKLSLKA